VDEMELDETALNGKCAHEAFSGTSSPLMMLPVSTTSAASAAAAVHSKLRAMMLMN
jgi:hypothetical protein